MTTSRNKKLRGSVYWSGSLGPEKQKQLKALNALTTSEMDDQQWKLFCDQWVKEYADAYMQECDLSRKDARTLAELKFEDCVGQEGFTRRDEDVRRARGDYTESRCDLLNDQAVYG